MVFFFKQKTAYEMRISDWSSDVCSSDLTPVALQYDSGDYDATLDAALKLADVDGFPRRKQEAASRGKLRGLGFSTYLEACGIAPSSVVGSPGARAGLYESAIVERKSVVWVKRGSVRLGLGGRRLNKKKKP